ncbi:MAG: nucleotide exchange factor GrpE [Lachnospiraceae bacterium]|nr:nucleotide exchange factor GrpE [Lachnospiraceae bacterium]
MEEEIKKDLMEEEVQEENTDAVETDAVKTDETMSEDAATDTAADAENEPEEEAADSDEEEDPDKKDETADTDGRNKKDGFFKKKKDKKDEQIEDLQDRLKRQMAEFDNFRKRTEKEKSQMFDMGARTIIEKILPVVDNFERGLAAVPEDQKEDAFVTGMDKVYKQLMTELEAIGVKPIETEGKEFDPELHNAVMQVENEELEAGTIAQELQKGYYYKDTVVRHSMVSVVS